VGEGQAMTLATSHQGAYTYRIEGKYVIQFRANGERVGYLCTIGAWQREFHKITDKT
jgi:hypothetical protein